MKLLWFCHLTWSFEVAKESTKSTGTGEELLHRIQLNVLQKRNHIKLDLVYVSTGHTNLSCIFSACIKTCKKSSSFVHSLLLLLMAFKIRRAAFFVLVSEREYEKNRPAQTCGLWIHSFIGQKSDRVQVFSTKINTHPSRNGREGICKVGGCEVQKAQGI